MFGPISSPSTSFLNLPQLFHDHQIRFFIHPVAKKYNRDFARPKKSRLPCFNMKACNI
jgi:hypothetical protein